MNRNRLLKLTLSMFFVAASFATFLPFIQESRASQDSPMHLAELHSEKDYVSLVQNLERIGHIKYTVEISRGQAGDSYFQNTTAYPYHLPFLKTEISKYKTLTNKNYEDLIFASVKEEQKLLVGSVFYVKKWPMPGTNERGFLAYSVYYRDQFPIEDVILAHKILTQKAPLAKNKLAFTFENPQDFFRYRQQLKSLGITSISMKLLEKRGNIFSDTQEANPLSDNLDKVLSSSNSTAEKINCGESTLNQFTLDSLDKLPSETAVKPLLEESLSDLKVKDWNFIVQSQSPTSKVQLSVCFDEINEKAELVQVDLVLNGDVKQYVKSKSPMWKVKGLESALFGDYKNLDVSIISQYGETRFFLRGGNGKLKNTVVTGAVWKVNANDWRFFGSPVLVGKLTAGDPLSSFLCKQGSRLENKIMKLETITFKFEICTFFGGGNTTGYNFNSISVNDKFQHIPSKYRNHEYVIDNILEYKEKGWLENNWVHHNEFDSLKLFIPETNAQYNFAMNGLPTPENAATLVIKYGNGQKLIYKFSHHFIIGLPNIKE